MRLGKRSIFFNFLSLFSESCFAALKYTSLRYIQSTLSESTLLTMTIAHVNGADEYLTDTSPISHDEKMKEKTARMRDSLEYDRLFFKKVFQCETYEELMQKLQ